MGRSAATSVRGRAELAQLHDGQKKAAESGGFES